MPNWKKLLARIVTDRKPVTYTYEQLSNLLVNHLGFTLAKPIDGSHRRFRRRIPNPSQPGTETTVIIGLVAPGVQKPEYVKAMVRTLRANALLPDGVDAV